MVLKTQIWTYFCMRYYISDRSNGKALLVITLSVVLLMLLIVYWERTMLLTNQILEHVIVVMHVKGLIT